MKYLNRFAATALMMLLVTSITVFPAFAQYQPELEPEKVEAIRNNCLSAQSAIQRTQMSDIVTRTNKGRSYEYILRLMASLNSRIALNKLSESRMSEVTSELQNKFNQFYGHYTEYETSIDRALRINCVEQPEAFYGALEIVRANRATLTNDKREMRQLIDEYDQLVTDLRVKLEEQS